MTAETKTIQKHVEVQERTETLAVVCDFCGKRVEGAGIMYGRTEWKRPLMGEHEYVTVACRTGNIWPEGDFTQTRSFDCCADCFDEKIAPLAITGPRLTEEG